MATSHPSNLQSGCASSMAKAMTSTTSMAGSEPLCLWDVCTSVRADRPACELIRYVWLVPQYTTEPHRAATGFEIVIQGGQDPALDDLAKGAGGDFRYLLPMQDITQKRKVVQVVLRRQDQDLHRTPDGWDGRTIDINKNRGKTFLYLLWKTASVQ